MPSHSDSLRTLIDTVRRLAEPLAEARGCEIVAVEAVGSPSGRRVLRVSIDRVGGATIEDCTRVSRGLSPALDAEDLIPGAYDLELSTPGQERPVQLAADFERFKGCEVRIKLWGMDGRRRMKATLLGCADGVVHVQTEQGPRDIPLDDIERANLALTFEQYTRLGEGLHPLAEGDTP
jgi:ribosome maturation factor RimP